MNTLATLTRTKTEDWKPFSRVPNAKDIANGLRDIPKNWSLTPLQDKSPRRENWQTEEFIPHSEIARLILHGEKKISKKGNPYTAYWSGFGLRTGEASDGKLAIDVDGSTAEPLLNAICGGNLPKTVSWTSGKPGRYQLLFQIPNEVRALLKDFNRAVLTEWENLQTARDAEGKPTELLEFRYNRSQSCLPPSRHPTTGSYQWINSPETTEVAIAPSWLCELLIKFATQEQHKEQERQERAVKWSQMRQQGTIKENSTNLIDFLEFEVLPRLSAEQIYCWEGHNFRQYGKTIKGCPPWRQSASGTSFHVWWDGHNWAWQDKATGEGGTAVQYRWKLCGGHGTPKGHDFAEIVEELARDAGVTVPEAIIREPQSFFADKRVITRAEWEIKQIKADLVSFQNLITQTVAPFQPIFKKFGKGLSNQPAATLPKVEGSSHQIINYKPGNIPVKTDDVADIRIQCTPDQHIQAWLEAVSKGWKLILDKSHPGLGKSYRAGMLTAAQFGIDKLIYQDANHRNPSTLPIETNFVDLPVRHNGFKLDPTRQTPLGENFQLWIKPGETADTVGNCHRTYLFNAFRNKNFTSLDFEESDISPICNGCTLKNQCRFASGDGYGFRFQKRTTIHHFRELRAHPDSTPTDLINVADQAFTVGRIWEEAGTLIKPVRSLDVNQDDFEKTVGQLALNAPSLLVQLQPVIQALHPLFTQDIDSPDRYGFNDASIRSMLPPFPSDLDIEAFRQALEPDLKFLEDLDTIDVNNDKQLKKSAAARYAAKQITKDSARNAGREFLDLPLYWLPDFLEAWKGEGAFSCSWGVLSIYRKNPKHIELVNSAQFNIFLDATLTTSLLKLKLDCSDPVLVIEQQRPDYANLSVINVTGLGKLPKYRSPSLIARVNALKEALTKLHSQLGIIDWKAIADTATDRREYGHFVDGRGVNRFSDADALASFGIPYQNIGVLAAQLQVMTGKPVNLVGTNSTFQKCLTELVQAEIIQEIGRLRSHRRPTEQLTFYFCADYDLSFLADHLPNVKLQSIDACQLCPEAGTASQQTGIAIVNAFTQLWQSKQKITQTVIAKIADISQAWVSRFTKVWGGWARFKKILLLLLDCLHSDSNKNFSELEEDEQWLASEYFPMLCQQPELSPDGLLDEVALVAKTIGNRAMERVLHECTPQVRANLLIAVLSCLPTEIYSISLSPVSGSGEEAALSP
ncbi:bifunctional DNA primase/polymerase [Tolypothrix sp. FACHB-123]|uniref:bifunctional DNA primase/polymerase n=1 Tax=Tolypothrix sp. FACHB-123 TaxID=2692868 RepID=UPI0018EFC78A|nr:bifunctional DNA primase/polymerase [Tolypothrix sp. FACHB-123]